MKAHAPDSGAFYLAPWRRALLDTLGALDGALDLTPDEEVGYIVHATARICSRMAASPPAYVDLSTLTAVRGPMAWRIADTRGLSLREDAAVAALRQVLYALRPCLTSEETRLDGYARMLMGSACLMLPGLLYSITCGIGRAMDCHFSWCADGSESPDRGLEEAFLRGKAEGMRTVSRTESPTRIGFDRAP